MFAVCESAVCIYNNHKMFSFLFSRFLSSLYYYCIKEIKALVSPSVSDTLAHTFPSSDHLLNNSCFTFPYYYCYDDYHLYDIFGKRKILKIKEVYSLLFCFRVEAFHGNLSVNIRKEL